MSQTSTPNSSWKGLPSWLVFAFLIIGPPIPIVVFVRSLTQNPLLITLLVFVYEITLFVLRFMGKIWVLLEDSLAKYAAQWVTIHVQEIVSRPYRTYYQHLIYEHQIFDVKGLSTRTAHDLELEQVFVDLRINPIAAHKASADPLHSTAVPEQLQGTHSIWDYLSAPSPANSHLIILGAPGSGKTTLLKHLALTLAQPRKYPHRQRIRHRFPILLFLHDYARTISEQPDFSLGQALQEHIEQTWQQNIPATWINQHLNKGTCLILLDGLDEVADINMRKQVVVWVQRQLLAYGQNRFLLTSRPYGYQENPIEGVTVLDVQTFTNEQIERFVQNWYLANELKSWGKDDPGVRLRANEGARDLMARLYRTDALLAFAVNPLLLTMIATVHRYRSSLPGRRVELYVEVCEVFLGKRYEARGIVQDLSPIQKQQVLQLLAYSFMQQGKREMTSSEAEQIVAPALSLVSTQMLPTDFLRMIERTSGLLLEPKPGHYSFAHKTFQEYLAAVYIKQKGLEQELATHVAESWWHETIRLYCAQADATVLILACLARKPFTVSSLTLALECDEEKLEIQPHAQTQLTQMLNMGMEDRGSEHWTIIVEALVKRRIRHMIHLNKETYMDTSLVTCAEYQLFVDEQQKQGLYYQPSHWTNYYFVSGRGHSPVSGVSPTEARVFCTWLTKRDPEHWLYRLPCKRELEDIEENLYNRGVLATGTAYWLNEEKPFIQVKGSPPLSNIMSEEQLEASFSRNYQQLRAYPFNLENAAHQELAKCLAGARNLAQIRYLTSQLIRFLRFTREGISSNEIRLQAKLQQAHAHRQKLENNLQQLTDEEAYLEKNLKDALNLIWSLEIKQQNIALEELSVEKNLKDVKMRIRQIKQDKKNNKNDRNRLKNISNYQEALERYSNDILSKENSLEERLDNIKEYKIKCEEKIEEIRAIKRNQQMQDELERARQDEHACKEDLSAFHTRTDPFSTNCDRLLAIVAPLYERKQFLSITLAHNHILNLDQIFDNTWYHTSEDALNFLNGKSQSFIQNVTLLYNNNYQSDFSDKSQNIQFKKTILTLNRLLDDNTIYDSARRLDTLLKHYVNYFSEHQHFIGKSHLTRLAVRYLAAELANHLFYWSWETFFIEEERERAINRRCLDAFSNISAAFTILEERIEEKSPAYEGILLIKERQTE